MNISFSEILKDNISCAVAALQSKIESDVTIFHIDNSSLMFRVASSTHSDTSCPVDMPIGNLYDYIKRNDEDEFTSRSKKKSAQNRVWYQMQYL